MLVWNSAEGDDLDWLEGVTLGPKDLKIFQAPTILVTWEYKHRRHVTLDDLGGSKG